MFDLRFGKSGLVYQDGQYIWFGVPVAETQSDGRVVALTQNIFEFARQLEKNIDHRFSNDRGIELEEPGHGTGGGPIIEGQNNKVRRANDFIKQGKLAEAKELLQEAIEGFQMIIEGNQDTNPNNLGYQMAEAAKHNQAVAENLYQKIQQDQKDKGTPAETKTTPEYGGIDLTAVEPRLQIKRDQTGVPLPLPYQNIQNINLDGLKLIIIEINPATFNEFPFLISLKEKSLQ